MESEMDDSRLVDREVAEIKSRTECLKIAQRFAQGDARQALKYAKKFANFTLTGLTETSWLNEPKHENREEIKGEVGLEIVHY